MLFRNPITLAKICFSRVVINHAKYLCFTRHRHYESRVSWSIARCAEHLRSRKRRHYSEAVFAACTNNNRGDQFKTRGPNDEPCLLQHFSRDIQLNFVKATLNGALGSLDYSTKMHVLNEASISRGLGWPVLKTYKCREIKSEFHLTCDFAISP